MSGQQIGTVVGGVIGAFVGYFAGGNVVAGWQVGAAIGGAIGGYVDPEIIKGPKLSDPKQQTSAEGVPRPVIYGTDATMGNVIQCQSIPTRHIHRERTGKGGPVQETNTYTRIAALRICEAAPLGGEMKLRRAWMNGKLAIDRTGTGSIDAETAKLLGQIRFYSGSETQDPDPDLESLPAGDGGGVGNVPAHRGSCYVVLRNVDVTNSGGALPQFLWEVSSDATESEGAGCGNLQEWLLISTAGLKSSADGVDWSGAFIDPVPLPGNDWAIAGQTELRYRAGAVLGVTSVPDGSSPYGAFRDGDGVWNSLTGVPAVSSGAATTAYSGSHWFISGPEASVSANGMTYSSLGYNLRGMSRDSAGVLGFVSTGNSSIYTPRLVSADGGSYEDSVDYNFGYAPLPGSLRSGYGDGVVCLTTVQSIGGGNYDLRIHSTSNGGGTITAEDNPFTSFPSDPGIALIEYSNGLGVWMVVAGNQVAIGATPQTLAVDAHTFPETPRGIGNDGAKFIVCGDNGMLESWDPENGWQTLTSGTIENIYDVVAVGSAVFVPPDGSAPMPDSPGFYITLENEVVGCAANSVTPNTVYLDSIVADLCDRVEVTDYDVTPLAATPVRGFSVRQPADAAGCIQALQQVYSFDFPEWGDSGETNTTLRAVPRGGTSLATITDDDLVDSDEDETTRAQQVEFPRKLNLIAPDPESNYEAIKQTSERESENVKATGEVTVSTAVVMTRDECAPCGEVMHKVAWEQALGTAKMELPEEFTRLVPSDVITRDSRRYRIDKVSLGDGTVKIEATRDRARSYQSNATGSDQITPPVIGSALGPTMFQGLNLPSLRTSDNVPGMYIGVCGRLPAWSGCDLYMSVDGGVSEQWVATIIDPSIMGYLTAGISASGEPMAIRLWTDDELDSVTAEQLAARMNAFAVTTDAVSEIGQFQTPTDTGDREWDLTDLTRPLLGTTAAAHEIGDDFIVLDGSLLFLPIDISHAGKTLIFRPVTRGTDPAENATYEVVFSPQFTSVTVSAITVGGENITVDGQPIYVVNQNA